MSKTLFLNDSTTKINDFGGPGTSGNHIFWYFFGVCFSRGFRHRFFGDFYGFWLDFGSHFGEILEDFGDFFCRFFDGKKAMRSTWSNGE